MKKYVLLFAIGFIQFSFSQVIRIQPTFATENDSIVVYFDATKGDAGLKGFTGDVYAHTGVITNLSDNQWKYVMAPWATNYDDIKLTRDSTDHYHLVIGYPREYYSSNHQNLGSIPSNEHILKLAFVFRNADGSKTGRDVGGADIFADLSESGLNVAIVQPSVQPLFLNLNDSVKVVAISSGAIDLNLFVNDSLVSSVINDTLRILFKSE